MMGAQSPACPAGNGVAPYAAGTAVLPPSSPLTRRRGEGGTFTGKVRMAPPKPAAQASKQTSWGSA